MKGFVMSYVKYTALFVAFAFILAFILAFIGAIMFGPDAIENGATAFALIAYFITSIIITNMIVKSYGRVMAFDEIVKYTLCFSLTLVVINSIFAAITIATLINQFPFNAVMVGIIGAIIVVIICFSLFVLLPMFLTNKYLEKKY
jgi:hypothetical protein